MEKKVWVHKASSFDEVSEFETRYYLSMSSSERLVTIQYLRELAFKLRKKRAHGEGRKRLRRIIKVIQ